MAYERYAGAYTKKIKFNDVESTIILSGRLYYMSEFSQDNFVEATNKCLYWNSNSNQFETRLIADVYSYLSDYAIIDNVDFIGSIFDYEYETEEEEILPDTYWGGSFPLCIAEPELSINIPSEVKTYIVNEYLSGCVKNFSISNDIEYFGGINNKRVQYATINVSGLKSLSYYNIIEPDNLASNGSYTVIGTLEKLEVIEASAFLYYNGEDLRKYKIGASLKEIKEDAFSYCTNLKYITEDNYFDCDFKGRVFNDCPKIEVLSFGNNASVNGVNLGGLEECLSNLETAYKNGEEIRSEDYSFASIIYVEPYTGSNQNEEGYQIIEVKTNNATFMPRTEREIGSSYTLFTMPIGMYYLGGCVYVEGSVTPVVGSDLIHVSCGTKIIKIKSYNNGELALAIGGVVKRVKIVDLDNVNASPVHIAIDNEVKAISY